MPLTRANVTAASRIMLPAYVVFFACLGLTYTLTPRAMLSANSGALGFADGVLPLPAWGAMFLSMAALMLAALVVGQRTLFRFALWVCAVALAAWSLVLLSASLEGDATPAASTWPLFVMTACIASQRSLLVGEVS